MLMFAKTSIKYTHFGRRLLPNLKDGLFQMVITGVT